MGFSCPICSEKLEKLPAEGQTHGHSRGEVNISATPCGHIFHSYCIQKWLTGNLQSSKQCPCCRKEVPKLRCLALFPNNYDDSILDDSMSQADFPAAAPCNHGELITSLKTQITRLELEAGEKKQLYDLLTTDYETLEARFQKEKLERDVWMIKAKQFESYKDVSIEFEKRAKFAEGQLKQYSSVENMLKGMETDVNEEIVNYPATVDSVRNLIEMKQIMAREFRINRNKLKEVSEKYERIRSEKMKLKVQYEKNVRDLKELRQVYEISRLNGRIRERSPTAGPSSAMGEGTPQAFRIKRRFQEPIPSPVELRSDLPSTSGGGVDTEVDLFPTTVKAKKIKSTKTKAEGDAGSQSTGQSESKKKKFPCALSPIDPSSVSKVRVKPKQNLSNTITLSDDEELLDLDDDDFKIRGNVPGAPLPISASRMKSFHEKSKSRPLGVGTSSKKFKFTKR